MKFEELKKIAVYTVSKESNNIYETARTLEELKDLMMRNQNIKATFEDCNENYCSIDYNDLSKFILFLDCLSCDTVTLE